ncbi:alpha-(1,6)-fucosyltransferase-like [Penaeus japonicus]|uniref:alpha-(1,6)-fucosyltransferase-like n=1 Tax=Penaeus japonicus TaxID=27405 RepID=UPI001C70F8F4|nr:alpha-(1,6)-fucosyltransferase-like [Penaeus japonicus]
MAVNTKKRLLSLAVVLVVLYCAAVHLALNTSVCKFLPQHKSTGDKTKSADSAVIPLPLLEALQVHRQVRRDVRYTWQFLRYRLKNLNSSNANVSALLEDLEHYFRVTSHDLAHFTDVDGFQEWQRKEAADLSALVQHRLHVLQNPRDCATAKKIYCDFSAHGRGIGSQLHHLSYCFLASYGTQRTLILNTENYNGNPRGLETFFLPLSDTCTTFNKSQMVSWPGKNDSLVVAFPGWDNPNPRPGYLPKSIPKDISERLMRLHGDPFAWWMGQFFKYAMRMNKDFQKYTDDLAREMGYESPIVGVQIRRSDKLLKEAIYLDLSKYMEAVEDFYAELEMRQPVAQRRIFLATDDPNTIPELKRRYPKYHVAYSQSSIDSTRMSQRTKGSSVRYLLADVYFLSRSDFLVCGMTSNICRLAYELMQAAHPDASTRASSVDQEYFMHYGVGDVVKARFPHEPRSTKEMEMQKGDLVDRYDRPINFAQHPIKKDGFQWGTNTRTKKRGYYPAYKALEILNVSDVQTFEHMKE